MSIAKSARWESHVKKILDVWAINTGNHVIYLSLALIGFTILEWVQRDKQHALQLRTARLPRVVRWSVYYSIIIVCFFMNGAQQDFIYFQF